MGTSPIGTGQDRQIPDLTSERLIYITAPVNSMERRSTTTDEKQKIFNGGAGGGGHALGSMYAKRCTGHPAEKNEDVQ